MSWGASPCRIYRRYPELIPEDILSLQLTGEQRAMVDIVRDFCAKEFATRAQRMARTEGGANPHNRDIAAQMGSLGWLGLSIPESCGGSGGGLFEACLFVEALSHGRAPLSNYPVTLIVAHTYLKFAANQSNSRCSVELSPARSRRLQCLNPDRVQMSRRCGARRSRRPLARTSTAKWA